MSSIKPTSWQFYVGSFVSNESAALANGRSVEELQRATAAACTAGPTFDPARCAYLAQSLGRVQQQRACTSGQVLTAAPQAAAAAMPSFGQVLAATNAVDAVVSNQAVAALGTPLNNTVCTA